MVRVKIVDTKLDILLCYKSVHHHSAPFKESISILRLVLRESRARRRRFLPLDDFGGLLVVCRLGCA